MKTPLEILETKLEKEKNEKQINSYIFNQNEIIQNKSFPILEFGDCFGYGMFLAKNTPIYNKKREFLGVEQRKVPCIITNKGILFEIGSEFEKREKIRVTSLPNEETYPDRLSLDSLKKFLINRKWNEINGLELFNKIKNEYNKYIYFGQEGWYDVQALWDIGTYFFMFFDYYPINELRGLKGSGKTKVMTISRQFTFNATEEMVNPSEAVLFRETHELRPTKYIDEAEKLYIVDKKTGKVTADPRAELLNSGFKYTGTCPRMEKLNGKFVTTYYKTYSPSMVGSINGLYGATEDRAIIHIMTKPPKNDKRGNYEPKENDSVFQEIRDELYFFAFQNWSKVKREYRTLQINELKNRDSNIWKPLLSIAKVIDESLYEKVLKFAKNQTEIKLIENISESSTEFKILKIMSSLISEDKPILIQDISNSWIGEYKPSNKTIGHEIDRLGFRDYKGRDGEGKTCYKNITKEVFESIVYPIIPSLFSSDSSDSSENKEIKSKVKETTLKKTEESEASKTILSEESEANEESEAVLKKTNFSKDIVITFLKDKDVVEIGDLLTELICSCNLDQSEAEAVVSKLLRDGDIYQPRSGFVRLM